MTDLKSLTQQAQALKAAGRLDDAIRCYRQAATAFPRSGVAEHNLGAALGDAGRHPDAVKHLQQALAKGVDAAETWLALARSLLQLGRLDDAESHYLQALRRKPELASAHHELAQLRWMRSGDRDAALAAVDQAIARTPNAPGLHLLRARILEYTGDLDAALEALRRALSRWPDAAPLLISASHLAVMTGRAEEGLVLAEQVLARHSDDRVALTAVAYACLASGAAARAAEVAARLHAAHPLDQSALALLDTAWRLLGDARHERLYDYASLVRSYRLNAPSGWPDLDAYLQDLASALLALHPFQTHPFGQSVRHGSQVADVTRAEAPAIQALEEALAEAIDAHLVHLGSGEDPLRSRNTGRWRIHGIWSVRLTPGGFHANHVHPDGWISSACYIALPVTVTEPSSDRAGWIQFGEPGMPTQPVLEAEHMVQPEPGTVVLFPSYMWHGTRPFGGSEPRLTVAFDVVPD
ncbi:MAG: tetratricopeptide repeat protein [Gammaproteobacteria bacterium]|nr:MAG: tetratricopeptide repeat protein [Gammaproteobacteria bacterium]